MPVERQITKDLRELRANMDGSVEATTAMLLSAVREAGYWISGDLRVGEADLAKLLGMTPGALANKRRDGSGPPAFSLGGGGHRVTYRIIDVAKWLESHREG